MLTLLLALVATGQVELLARDARGCGVPMLRTSGGVVPLRDGPETLCVLQAQHMEEDRVALLVEAPHRFDASVRRRVFVYDVDGTRLQPRFLGSGFPGVEVAALRPAPLGDLGLEVETPEGLRRLDCRFDGFPLVCDVAKKQPVVNAASAKRLGATVEAQLWRDGSVAVEGREKHFFSLYDRNAYERIPSFVTTDVVLHVFHVRFDAAVADLERQRAVPALTSFARRQVAAATALFPKQGALSPDLQRLALYHAVPLLLLDKEAVLDPRLTDAEPVAQAIRRGTAIPALSACPAGLDVGLFTARGHYDHWQLEPYFQAASFYAHCGLSLSDPRPALDIMRLADATALSDLEVVRGLQAFISGPADDPGLEALRTAAGSLPALPRPLDAATVARVRQALDKRPQVASLTSGPTFRLLGGSATPDGILFGQVAGTVARPFPSALDLLAALGSPRAAQHLQLPAQGLAAGGGLYARWLDVLRALLAPAPEPRPRYATTDAWSDRTLVSAAGSWTELRHDTILYVKQPMVMMEGGHEAELPAQKAGGYVDPRPDVYRALRQLLRELEAVGGSQPALDNLLGFLIEVAELELLGKALPPAADERLRGIGVELEHLTRGHADRLPDQALVADVFTLATPDGVQRVLHAGVGDVDELWVVVPRGGREC